MPDSNPSAPESIATAQASFEPYCQLLRNLMPSLRGVAIHDGFGNPVWASEDWAVPGEETLVRDCIANALSDTSPAPAISRSIDEDRALYSFALRADHIDLIGIVSLCAAVPPAMGAPRSLQYVRQLAQSAIECLRRELTLRSTLSSREHDLGGRERDIEVMLQIASARAGTSSDADELGLILKTGLEHLGCAQAALWVPDKNIRVVQSRGEGALAPETLKRVEQHLLAWMRLQQRTMVINRVARMAPDAPAPHKILACPVRHPSERVMGVLALFNPPGAGDFDLHQTRITEMLAKRAAIVIQGQYDASTGLLTRHAFEEQAKMLFATDAMLESHSILYLDIDRMHVINETFGMLVGDETIVSVADCLAKSVPPETLCARISGDRLAALLPYRGLEEASAAAEAVRGAAAAIAPRVGRGAFDVSVSIGVAPVSRSDKPLAHALAIAEIACKAAKDRGRNRIEAFQDSDQSIIRRHTDIQVIGQIKSALEENGFLLDAQPILPLRGAFGRPRFELLLRMLGDRGEIISPAKFLSAAERYQLMPSIDRWVVRRTCELVGAHRAAVGANTARFAINLSGQSLQDDTFLEFVVEQIKNYRVAADMLCFELTETSTIGNLRHAQAFIRHLQEMGCQFALDDFGTGVSSLAYLKDLSVNYVKIDGSFVRDILGSPRSESMIRAIAQLAKVVGMETIAEYVETDALRARVAELGVDYGQGFAMGKAQRLETLLEELAVYESSIVTHLSPALFEYRVAV